MDSGAPDPYNAAVDELAQIGISRIELGVPPPKPQNKRSVFVMQLRAILGRMAVHDSVELQNVARKKEKLIRVRVAEEAKKLGRSFTVRVEKRPKSDTRPRSIRVWRLS